jgi:lipoprotein-releasing system ATP-binding protein
LLLADEPTGNLDPNTSEEVFALLLSVIAETGLSALIATHNMELAARMNRQIKLQNSKLNDVNQPLFSKLTKNFY